MVWLNLLFANYFGVILIPYKKNKKINHRFYLSLKKKKKKKNNNNNSNGNDKKYILIQNFLYFQYNSIITLVEISNSSSTISNNTSTQVIYLYIVRTKREKHDEKHYIGPAAWKKKQKDTKDNEFTWCPTSQIILSSGQSNTWWSATVNSATPRLELRCPPVLETV